MGDDPPHEKAARASATRRVLTLITLLIALLAAGATTLMRLPVQWTGGPVAPRILDALHLPLFALATPALFALLPSRWPLMRRLLIAGALGLGFAATIELVQPSAGRSASWRDFIFGAMGVVLALGLLAFLSRPTTTRRQPAIVGLVIAALAATAIVAWPVWSAYRQVTKRGDAFPDLLPTDAAVTATFWKVQGGATLTYADSAGLPPLAVRTSSGQWSGVYSPIGSQDWSAMNALVLQLAGPATEPFTLGLRIDDTHSTGRDSRFNHQFEIAAGSHQYRVPLSELVDRPASGPLDLTRIARLALFVNPATPAKTFVLERAFLE